MLIQDSRFKKRSRGVQVIFSFFKYHLIVEEVWDFEKPSSSVRLFIRLNFVIIFIIFGFLILSLRLHKGTLQVWILLLQEYRTILSRKPFYQWELRSIRIKFGFWSAILMKILLWWTTQVMCKIKTSNYNWVFRIEELKDNADAI